MINRYKNHSKNQDDDCQSWLIAITNLQQPATVFFLQSAATIVPTDSSTIFSAHESQHQHQLSPTICFTIVLTYFSNGETNG